ncbi:hypothetical protein OQA88_4321 [Cercophora sp. LCS_1]
MKLSLAVLAIVAGMVSAVPAPAPAELYERQAACAAVNEACLDSSTVGLLTPLGPLIALIPGFTLSGTTAALTCCAGYTCTGGSAALPGSLGPLAPLIGGPVSFVHQWLKLNYLE